MERKSHRWKRFEDVRTNGNTWALSRYWIEQTGNKAIYNICETKRHLNPGWIFDDTKKWLNIFKKEF